MIRAVLAAVLALPLAAQRPGPGPAITQVELRLVDARGGPIQSARVQLLGVVKGVSTYRKLPEQAPRTLTPKDFTGDCAVLAGLPVGEFVLRIDTDDFAVSCTAPFTIPAEVAPRLLVTLHRGALLEGVVHRPDGKPLEDAEVRIEDAERPANQHPLAQLLQGMFTDVRTHASARTDAAGRYHIEHVAPGPYRLIAQHADFAPGHQPAAVDGDDRRTVPPITVADGVLVVGMVTRGGKPVAGAEVTLESAPVGKGGGAIDRVDVCHTAVTDAEGRFRMPARVPFDREYTLSACEDGPPLQKAGDLSHSRSTITPKKGRAEQEELLLLPPRR